MFPSALFFLELSNPVCNQIPFPVDNFISFNSHKMSAFPNTISVLLMVIICAFISVGYKIREDKTKCPKVKALRNFDLNQVSFVSISVQDFEEFFFI